MVRKLNTLKEVQTSLADLDMDRLRDRAQLRQQYLERITSQLGITTAQLSELPTSSAVQTAIDPALRSELVLTQQCTDLVKDFVQIQDPQDRMRCLQIVRDTARLKSSGSTR